MECINSQNLKAFQENSIISRRSFSRIEELIGNTPLLAIDFRYGGIEQTVFAKAEYLNLSGSIKDRMALHILKEAYRTGEIKTGDTIVEATSGNTGISFAAVGRAFGHQVKIFMPDWMSRERISLIKSYGAQVVLISKEEGGFLGSIDRCEKFARENENVFLPCQFSNSANPEAHYLSTGPEIIRQLASRELTPDAFVAGVGTGGTIMGAGSYLRSKFPKVRIYPLEPLESPTLTTGYKVGSHRIQGISDEFIPEIVKLAELDQVISVSDGDSILMAQKLASELGLAVGISSGANFLGALRAIQKDPERSVVVTVFADDNKKYLSTDLVKEESRNGNYLSNEIELTGYQTIGRISQSESKRLFQNDLTI